MATTAQSIQEIYIGLLGRAADKAGLDYWTAEIDGNTLTLEQLRANIVNDQAEYAADLGTKTRAQTVSELYSRMFERAADSADLTYWVNGDGASVNVDQLVLALTNGAAASDRLVLDNKTEAAVYYTDNTNSYSADGAKAAVDSVDATAATLAASKTATDGSAQSGGSTFTLTTAVDTISGTGDNDIIVGTATYTAAGLQTPASGTLATGDTINGAGGTDTFNLTIDGVLDGGGTGGGDAVNLVVPSVSNVETLAIRNVATSTAAADDITVNASNFSGLTTFNSDRSTGDMTVTNLADGANLTVTGNGTVANGDLTASYVAGATAGVLNVVDGTTAGAVALNGAGNTSLTINSTGASNTLGAVSSTGTGILTTTINADTSFTTTGLTIGTNAGTQSLVVAGAAADKSATTTAAATSAVVLGALDADYASIDASGLTAGGVSATLSATVAATFTGGAGNDTVTTSTSAQTGAVNAGAGTDTLILGNTVDIDTTAEGAIYTNFEVLEASNGVSLDMDLLTGSSIESIVINDAAGATAITDMSATQAANVTIKALAGAATLGVKGATTVATSDVLNITVSDGDSTGSEAIAGTGDLTIAGVETINITATDDITLASTANVTGMTSLTATGDGDVSITTGAMAVESNTSIDFSGLTTDSTFDFSAATGNALGFTGGAGVDTVSDSVVGGNVISTGAGNDVVTLAVKTGGPGTSGTSVNLGTGGDSLVATAAEGSDADEVITMVFADGDSVIDATTTGTGFVATKMDAVTGLDLATAAASGAGHVITFDTVGAATAVTFQSSAVTFGTTTVTNAFDYLVYNTGAGGITYVYQDTDGDKIIEDGEFGIQLTGVAATATVAGEFSVASGDLVLSTLVG